MTPLLELVGIDKSYPQSTSLFSRPTRMPILQSVDLRIHAGETLGLVGESGSGKSTIGRIILKITEPSAGAMLFDGVDATVQSRPQLRAYRKSVQMIFQDAGGSLNPSNRVAQAIDEPLQAHFPDMDKTARRARVVEFLHHVGLDAATAGARYPHAFSGGQRQRIAIARALAVGPKLIVADEPVSALDVSVQAQVLTLLCDLRDRLGLAYLFIAHDLAVVRQMSQRVAVIYRGRIVETASSTDIYLRPAHPYTRALLDAIPRMVVARRAAAAPPEIEARPLGCAFLACCPARLPICADSAPATRVIAHRHSVACHNV